MAEVAIKPVVGVFPYATGVEDNDVRVLRAQGRDHPFGFEKAGQALGVVLVHLAPICAYEVAAGLSWPFLVRHGHPLEPKRSGRGVGSAGARRAIIGHVASVERVPASLLPRRRLSPTDALQAAGGICPDGGGALGYRRAPAVRCPA